MTHLVPPALYFVLNSGSLDIPRARPGVVLSSERRIQGCIVHCNVVLGTVLNTVLYCIVLKNSFRYTSGSGGRNTRGDKNLSTMLVDRSVDYDNLSTRSGDACGAAGLLFVPKNLSTEKPVDSSRLA